MAVFETRKGGSMRESWYKLSGSGLYWSVLWNVWAQDLELEVGSRQKFGGGGVKNGELACGLNLSLFLGAMFGIADTDFRYSMSRRSSSTL